MRVKATANVTARMDSVYVSISIYSNANDMKETLEDNIKKTHAIQGFLEKETPHKKDVVVSFGRPTMKSVRIKDTTVDENGKTVENMRWEYQGYEMRSFVGVELSLGSHYKLHNVYNEAMKYKDCSVNIQYVFSSEHKKDIARALREKLIAEADSQIHDILPATDVVMVDFAYHCNLPEAHHNNDMCFGKRIESERCSSMQQKDDSISEEYAKLIDEIFSMDMAPEEEFSDQIIVEYAEKKG